MTLQEQKELVQKAIDNNHAKELFLGEGEYKWGNLKHIPANVATDIGAIIDNGFYKIYQDGNKDVGDLLCSSIKELLCLNKPHASWTAYFILRYLLRNELQNKAPFNIVTRELCQTVSKAISSQKQDLSLCHEYVGAGLKNGLWEDIQRLDDVLFANYGVKVI